MGIIDGHMHGRGAPGRWFADCADARGYEAYAFLSLSCMAAYGGERNNEEGLEAKRADPERAYFFAGLIHPCADPLAHVQRWLLRGADGVKLIETKPTVWKETGADLADAAYEPLFAFLEEAQVPVLWHVGDPATFWKREEAPDFAFQNGWFYGDGGFPALSELYDTAETVLQRHPRLRAALAHLYFCSDDPAHLEWLLDRYENVYVDITPGVEMYDAFDADRPFFRDFFLRRQERILLGTDTDRGDAFFGETPLALALRALGPEGLDLPKAALEKITRMNFRAFAGARPKPL